jgi:HEAT repeat protein
MSHDAQVETGGIRVDRIESLLNTLVLARKSLQLYPDANPVVKESLKQLALSVADLFSDEAFQIPPGENDDPRSASLVLGVARDGFLFGDDKVASKLGAVCSFAQELYRQGVKLLWLAPGLNSDEIQLFLDLTCRTDQAKEEVSLFDAFEQAALTHVGVDRVDTLHLVDADDAPEQTDMMGYLRHRQATRQRPGEGGGEAGIAPPHDDSEDVSDLAEFFLELAQGAPDKNDYLFNTLTDPDRLAETLSYVADLSDEGATEEGVVSIDVLRQMLQHVADSIRGLPDEMRAKITENIGQAILTADNHTQERVMSEALAGQLDKFGMGGELTKDFSDEQVADLLCAHVKLHDGTENTIANFLHDFSADARRRQTIRSLVVKTLSNEEEEHTRKIAELLDNQGDDYVPQRVTHSRKEESVDPATLRSRDAIARELVISQDEKDKLNLAIELSLGPAVVEQSGLSLLHLLATGQVPELTEKRETFICNGIQTALQANHYNVVGQFLEAGRDYEEGAVQEALTAIVQDVTTRQRLGDVLTAMRSAGTDSKQYGRLKELFQMGGERAADVVFDRLNRDRDPGTRQYLLALFVELGEDGVQFLARRVTDNSRSVVSNAVYLLGQLRAEAGVEALAQALAHSDIRVRREVLRALATIGGTKTEQLLIQSLGDPEPVIRGLAAEWLGIVGAASVLPSFLEKVTKEHRKLRKQPDVAIGVAKAIGRLGSPEHVRVLREFESRLKGFGVLRRDEMTKACEDAVVQIERRARNASGEARAG